MALFNSMRHEIEGTGAPQAQLLWRKVRGAEPGSGWALTWLERVASRPWASVYHCCLDGP